MSGEGVRARALRGSALTLISFGGSNLLRLASNLILTRLLFPEAFGLMALVSVVTVGLTLFADVGIAPSIAHSTRGDAPAVSSRFHFRLVFAPLLPRWPMTCHLRVICWLPFPGVILSRAPK